MIRSSTGLAGAARTTLILFGLGAPLFGVGLLGVLGVFGELSLFWLVLCVIVLVVAVALLSATAAMYRTASRWARRRRGPWRRMPVRVQPDIAGGELAKTVLQTDDGDYRILLLDYPLELRDRVHTERVVEYVGDLGHDHDLLVRPVGGGVETETFGRAKSMAQLRAERG